MNECIGVVGGADRAGLQLQSDDGQTKGSTSLFKKNRDFAFLTHFPFFQKHFHAHFALAIPLSLPRPRRHHKPAAIAAIKPLQSILEALELLGSKCPPGG